MPTVQLDENGNRIIIRHVGPAGPAGPGVPAGGSVNDVLTKTISGTAWASLSSLTGFVEGPSVATVDGNLAAFDGTSGLLLKDSGVASADVALKSYVDSRTPAIFTTLLRNKLDALSTRVYYRGAHASTAALLAAVTDPAHGDYATVTGLTEDDVYFYDGTSAAWRPISDYFASVSASAVATALFDDGASWSQADCNIFTDNYKALINSHEVIISTFLGGAGAGSTPIRDAGAGNATLGVLDRTVVMWPATLTTTTAALPKSADVSGRVYAIKNMGAGTVSAVPDGAETIDGTAAPVSVTTKKCLTIQSTGAGWIILSNV